MGADPDTEVLGFSAEYEEIDYTQKVPPRHARRRRLARRAVILLSIALAFAVGMSFYLWQQLDQERSNRTLALSENVEFQSSLSETQQQLAETEELLEAANDKLQAGNAEIATLERQIKKVQRSAADLEKQLKAATADLNESETAADELAAAISEVTNLIDACSAATAQVAEHADGPGGQFDRDLLAEQAMQAASTCASAAQAVHVADN